MSKNCKKMNALVSILIPVYNTSLFLSKCLDSVINQTYKSLQIVLLDDGSTDESLLVAKQYEKIYPDVVEVYHQNNAGVAIARNNLLDKVKGDYFLFVDSDDWIEPDMVEFLLDKAQCYNVDIVTCDMVKNDDPIDTEVDCISEWTQEEAVCEFLKHTTFRGSLWNKLLKRSLLHNEYVHCGIEFVTDISYGEDALFCWRLLQNVDRIVVTNKKLYHYRMNENSISHQPFGKKKMSAHDIWHIITEETTIWWPQYLNIAQARWGMEDMYLLRQAAQGGYKKDDSIRTLQETVKQFFPKMRKTGLLFGKEIINAMMMCRWYEYGVLYARLHEMKSKL